MNTPSHILYGAAMFGRHGRGPAVAAAAGGLLPDVPAFLFVSWATWIEHIERRVIFRELYFSPEWQAWIGPSHSIVVWLGVLGLALWQRWPLLRIAALAGLLHLAFDFPVHASDPHRHFWPLSDWRFHSPLSYWEPGHFRDYVQGAEIALALASAVAIFRHHRDWLVRSAALTLLLAYVGQMALFALWFGR
ncbi:MAG: cobalamin biosynthesis protein CobQ [Alphaproteobacteria bacterium]|nr:cobalamin biosynthesis protein CobQ [Alphaproteobacteria bacterium]